MARPLNRDQVVAIAAEIGSSLMPDNDAWVNRFTVDSRSSNAVYTVAQRRSDGTWGCSCWAWRTKRRCPHLKDILQRLTRVAEKPILVSELEEPVQALLFHARTAFLDLADAKPLKAAAPRRMRKLDMR